MTGRSRATLLSACRRGATVRDGSWVNAEAVAALLRCCDHSSSTSTPQQSHIKFGLHLFPESIISSTLFIFGPSWLGSEAAPDTNSAGCPESSDLPALKLGPVYSRRRQSFDHFGHLMWAELVFMCLPLWAFFGFVFMLMHMTYNHFCLVVFPAICGHCHTESAASK